MTIGPEPMTRIFEMSVLLGIMLPGSSSCCFERVSCRFEGARLQARRWTSWNLGALAPEECRPIRTRRNRKLFCLFHQAFSYGVLSNVLDMLRVVLRIPNAVIGKSGLPNLQVGTKFLLGSIRESTLDELDCSFQAG